jgi:hypothetical protein
MRIFDIIPAYEQFEARGLEPRASRCAVIDGDSCRCSKI